MLHTRFKPSEDESSSSCGCKFGSSLSFSLVDEVTSREKLVYNSYRLARSSTSYQHHRPHKEDGTTTGHWRIRLYTIPSAVIVPRTLSRDRSYSSAGHRPSASFDRASVDKTTTASVNCDSWSKMADVLLQKVGKRKWNSLPDSVFQ